MSFWGRAFSIRSEVINWYLTFSCLNNSNEQTLCFHDLINKLTFKDNTNSYGLTLFICGGPCRLSSFTLCSGDLIFILVYSVWNILIRLYLYHYLINIVNIKILSLNFFSKTTLVVYYNTKPGMNQNMTENSRSEPVVVSGSLSWYSGIREYHFCGRNQFSRHPNLS